MSTKKFAAVTGANRGIGRVTAISLAKQGWSIAVIGRDAAGIDAVAQEIGSAAIAVQCDVSAVSYTHLTLPTILRV